jgi:N-acetylmuramoyl-L-alanine amidase
MSYRLTVFSLVFSLLAAAPAATAADLNGLQLVEEEQGTRALVEIDALAGYKVFTLANPDRLVVDLADARAASGLRLPGPNGLVAGVRTGQPTPGTLRLVFDLGGPVRTESRIERDGAHARLVVSLARPGAKPASAPDAIASFAQPKSKSAPVAVAAAKPIRVSEQHAPAASSIPTPLEEAPYLAPTPLPAASTPGLDAAVAPPRAEPPSAEPVQAPALVRNEALPAYTSTRRESAVKPQNTAPSRAAEPSARVAKSLRDVIGSGQRKIVVAIDAGHGGKDPGAHGPSGVREKNVTLAVARELAKQINADPGMRAVLIRDNDSFVPLKQRYMKARSAQADLFISIHADASPNDTATGASVFVLSTRGATSQAARWLADSENAADLVGGVSLDEKDPGLAAVLFDLSQSATMRASDDLANSVLSSLKNVGKAHKQGIERANFVVLRSPDVPSMLVETGFITNPGEEQRLNDADYRGRLAAAITGGVRKYFTEQAPPGTWYAARRGGVDAAGGSELVAASPE